MVGAGLGAHDGQHALGVERLEVEAGRGVEVGRDRLGVGVDHDRLPALLAQRGGRPHRAVVELDALADAHRSRADDERGRPVHRRRLGRRSGGGIGGVEVGRLGGELGGAGVDHGEARLEADGQPLLGHGRLGQAGQRWRCRDRRRRRAWRDEQRVGQRPSGADDRSRLAQRSLQLDQPLHLGQEPGRDARRLLQLGRGNAAAEERQQPPEPGVGRGHEPLQHDGPGGPDGVGRVGADEPVVAHEDLAEQLLARCAPAALAEARERAGQVVERRGPGRVLGQEAGAGLLEAAERLVERRAEGAVDGHHLAGRLHLRAERRSAVGNLSNGKRGSLTTT